MWIQPNTKLKILKGVPLDDTYENTLFFDNANQQKLVFESFVKTGMTFDAPPSALTYQRVNLNTIRVNKVADELYDCNYIMFQNSAYGSKWFYAFIKEINYINDNVSELVYEIDVLQTWMLDYDLEECFVEREHSATDNVGDNLQDEGLPTGEYVYGSDFAMPDDFAKLDVFVCVSYGSAQTDPLPASQSAFYRRVYSGLKYERFTIDYTNNNAFSNTAIAITNYINSTQSVWGDRSDSIVSIYMAPHFLSDRTNEMYPLFGTGITRQRKTSGNIFDGYTPRNKKLYTYPYNFLYVTDFQGNDKVFPYEYFYTSDYGFGYDPTLIYFSLDGCITGQPAVYTVPHFYKHGETTHNLALSGSYDETMTIMNYPQCSYNTDTFRAWLAQMAGIAIGVGAGVGITAGIGAAAGSVLAGETAAIAAGTQETLSAGARGLAKVATKSADLMGASEPILNNMVANKLKQGVQAFRNPITHHGQQSGSALVAAGMLGFAYGNKHITRQYAEIIDQYFDMYGYATNRVKVPNRNVRAYWTYTKTIGCAIRPSANGGLPTDAIKKICSIYDKGIRFWTNANYIGQYSTYAPYNTPT